MSRWKKAIARLTGATLVLGLATLDAKSAPLDVISLTVTGGDFSMGAPGVGSCDSDPLSFTSFRCLTGGNNNTLIMGSYISPSITAFNFFQSPVSTFTAASAAGAAPNPTGRPSGTVDDISGAMSMDFGGWYAIWNGVNFLQGTNPNGVFSTSLSADGSCANIVNGVCNFDIRWHSYISTPPFLGQTGYWHLTGTATLRTPTNAAPVVARLTIPQAVAGGPVVSWTPSFTDANATDTHSCSITTPATRGTASIATDCTAGSYLANLDAPNNSSDSFSYTVTDNNSVGDAAGALSGTATVTVVQIVNVAPCSVQFPIKSITTNGGGQSPTVNATLAINFTGNITSFTNNSVKLCPNTLVEYATVSTVGTASCTVSGSAAADTGSVAPGQKLICSNQPTGSDTDRFRILLGP